MENGVYAHFLDNTAHGGGAFLHRRKDLSPHSVLDAVIDDVPFNISDVPNPSYLIRKMLEKGRIESPDHIGDLLTQANDTLYTRTSGILLASAAVTFETGNSLYIFNVGNSSVYLIRGKELSELTTLDTEPKRNAVVTHHIGEGNGFSYHIRQIELDLGDRLFLATNRITDNIYPTELYENVIKYANSPKEAVKRLQRLLNKKRDMDIGREGGKFKVGDAIAIFRYF